MKILWHSNAPWVPSGYGVQTALFAPKLAALGHDVAISAFHGLEGAVIEFDGIPVLPKLRDNWGNDILGLHAKYFGEGDAGSVAVLTLVDAWVLQPRVLRELNVAAWVPVDRDPLPPGIVDTLSEGNVTPIAMSRFGEKALRDQGFDPGYVPHGVDTTLFKPGNKAEARRYLGLPGDRFVVGMVAANSGNAPSRKAFPQAIEAFAQFRCEVPDALLYLHTDVSGSSAGVNVLRLLDQFQVPRDAWTCVDTYRYLTGAPRELLVHAYNAMDVLLAASMGEGFGVPLIEAQACGVSVIASDCTTGPELVGAGWLVEGVPFFDAPEYSYLFLPSVGSIIERLHDAYDARGDRSIATSARERAMDFDADAVTKCYWDPTLEALAERFAL